MKTLAAARISFHNRILFWLWRALNPMMPLDTVDAKQRVRVMLIDGGHRVRSHLNNLGIHIGDWLTVVGHAPFHGPVLVEVHGTRLALGRGIAAKIRVDQDGTLKPLVRPPSENEIDLA